ncbi:histidine--tRNA ligase [Candidatus Gracilibacteria bacterium]|nr:histidine--tRNA ligase [Candidatus Gracilibacteria bacterium]
MSKKYNVKTPSGFPEFSPAQEQVRQRWIKTIAEVFEKNGFLPINTPLVEREENLLGKGGNPKEMYALKRILDEEGDISHSGNALRFDHTVPLALYVARNFNDLNFPFRRYTIGPVFRGERAQKGRFRQFDQCDIDVIGNGSLSILNDAQMPAIIIDIFRQLMSEEPFVVRINNRKILLGFFESTGVEADKIKTVLNIVDELEKIGETAVGKKLEEQKVEKEAIKNILDFIQIQGSNETILEKLKEMSNDSDLFKEGVEELQLVVKSIENMGIDEKYFKVDLCIARGLDYYTGTVFETNLINYFGLGSICSGGRYEDLASVFTGKVMPGVGISIGLTRLLSQFFEEGLVKTDRQTRTQILVINVDEVALPKSLEIGKKLRDGGFFVENYLEDKKLGKKFDYADKMQIPYVVVLGEDELNKKYVQVKNMETGEKTEVGEDKLEDYFSLIYA